MSKILGTVSKKVVLILLILSDFVAQMSLGDVVVTNRIRKVQRGRLKTMK